MPWRLGWVRFNLILPIKVQYESSNRVKVCIARSVMRRYESRSGYISCGQILRHNVYSVYSDIRMTSTLIASIVYCIVHLASRKKNL